MADFAGQLAQAGQAASKEASKTAIEAGDWISSALILVLTIALVIGVRWAVRNRDPLKFATDPGVRTRVRLVQRMATTLVVLIGVAVAAAQLDLLSGIASTVLAGSAIVTVIVGFAARATLANALGGVILTFTQPLRVGDQVTIGPHSGVVDDVTLSATVLRTVLGTTIRIPNEQVTQSVIYNDTITGGGVIPEAWVMLPFGAPVADAVDLALDVSGVEQVRLVEIQADGWNRIAVRGERCAPGDRVPAEARLRLRVLEALRRGGLLAVDADAPGHAGPAQEEPPRI